MLKKSKTIRPHNPYVAGRPVGGPGFLGRKDIIDSVVTDLSLPGQNTVVLYGQRRIGKTSILLELENRLPSPPFSPVYFDLMDHAHQPLGQVLFDLASNIAAKLEMSAPDQKRFDEDGRYFQADFLSLVYKTFEEGQSLVLLLDEFDVLEMDEEEKLNSSAAVRKFRPYMRKLMKGHSRLKFVFVIGRKAEDLSIDAKATFKASISRRVSVLDEKSARDLIATAQHHGTLEFTEEAVDRVLALTAGHPLFIQLMCQILWTEAYARSPERPPRIEAFNVQAEIPKVLEAGENILEWIWDGLPPAERVVFAAIAEGTNDQKVVTEEDLGDILQRHGIRILVRELELAPNTLVKRELLTETDGGFRFFIELIRLWVLKNKPLLKVKDELDRVTPAADMLYQVGDGDYRRGDLENAQNQLRQALNRNPNHLKARLLLGQVFHDLGKLDEAIVELEEAYRYDETATRHSLVRVLLAKGEELDRQSEDEKALIIYDRVSKLSPRDKVAPERRVAIWIRRGDELFEADDLDASLAAYEQAEAREKIATIRSLKLERSIASVARQAQECEEGEDYQGAQEKYQWLVQQEPIEGRWIEALELVQTKQELSELYDEGVRGLGNGNWLQAINNLKVVVYKQPEYKDAVVLLSEAVGQKKKENAPTPSVEGLEKLRFSAMEKSDLSLGESETAPPIFDAFGTNSKSVQKIQSQKTVYPSNINEILAKPGWLRTAEDRAMLISHIITTKPPSWWTLEEREIVHPSGIKNLDI